VSKRTQKSEWGSGAEKREQRVGAKEVTTGKATGNLRELKKESFTKEEARTCSDWTPYVKKGSGRKSALI